LFLFDCLQLILHEIKFSNVNSTVRFIWCLFIPVLLFSCKNGCNNSTTENKDDSPVVVQSDPLISDSITPISLADTLGKDELGKDSIKFANLFQREANRLMRAEKDKDYNSIASFVPPEIISKTYKGKDNYIARLKQKDANAILYDRIICGPARRIAPAVDDQGYSTGWYCLMPVRSFRTIGGKKGYDERWLGGQASIDGKQVYFLDVTGLPREIVIQVMPDLVRFILDKEAGVLAQ